MKIIEEPPRSLTAVGAERWVVDVIKTEKNDNSKLKTEKAYEFDPGDRGQVAYRVPVQY